MNRFHLIRFGQDITLIGIYRYTGCKQQQLAVAGRQGQWPEESKVKIAKYIMESQKLGSEVGWG